MAWLWDFYSKVIKFPFVLRWEMRGEGRKIFQVLRRMRFLSYKQIPEKVLKEHKVTQALKDQQKLAEQGKTVEKAEFELVFNEQVEQALSLKEVQEIEKRLLQHEQLHGATGYEAEFGQKVMRILGNAHGEDKKLYFTYLEPIIKVAEKKGDYKALMERIRLLGPSQLHILSAIALRLEIRTASKELSRLRHDKKALSAALNRWDASKGNKELQENYIRAALVEIEKDIETGLHNDTLIAKRDFLLTLLTLKLFDDDEKAMTEYYLKHVMPRIPEELRIKNIENLKNKLADHAHELAQGLRRILHAEEQAEQLASQVSAAGRAKRLAA